MKASNILVFRNQKVKLGDMGISVKLRPGSKMDDVFELKVATQGYTNEAVSKAFVEGAPVTKRELFENDRFALIKTFVLLRSVLGERCKQDSPFTKLLYEIEDPHYSLEDIITRWAKHFADDFPFTDALV